MAGALWYRQGMLNFVVAPYGQIPGAYPSPIAFSYGGDNRTQLCPQDPQHYATGEKGMYYDTPLGAIPTDAELSHVYGYTPVTSGWVNAKEGYFPAPWNPPDGWNAAGAYGPQMSLNGLGDVTAEALIAATNAHNQRMFRLAILSTAAVSISAMFTLWTRYKRLKLDLKTKRKRR